MKKILLLAALLIGGTCAQADPFGEPVPRIGKQAPSTAAALSARLASPDGEFQLIPSVPVDEQLAAWATRSGWTFKWYSDVSWKVIAPSRYGKDFEKAFLEVMEILMQEEGKPIRFTMSRGNQVVEVYANDLR